MAKELYIDWPITNVAKVVSLKTLVKRCKLQLWVKLTIAYFANTKIQKQLVN